MAKKILVTGGAGFLGSHFLEAILKETDWTIVCLDRLDSSGNLNRIADTEIWKTEKHRLRYVYHDLRAEINDGVGRLLLMEKGNPMPVPFDYVVHMAAGSHVDRSISDPVGFVMDNVVGTANLWNFLRIFKDWALKDDGSSRVLNFGTDEVFGPAPEGVLYKEWDRHNGNNPYAATKAGAEDLVIAFAHTYGIPTQAVNCMNIYGERQHPEKFVPMTIYNVLHGKTVTIHANATKTKAGTRFYLHARNVCSAVLWVLQNGDIMDGSGTKGKYNIVGDQEVSNLEMAQLIADILGKPLKYEMVDFHSSRPGHDLRYGLDGTRLYGGGWKPPVNFMESMKHTVLWTVEHGDKWLPMHLEKKSKVEESAPETNEDQVVPAA